jgi:hypothetical protein
MQELATALSVVAAIVSAAKVRLVDVGANLTCKQSARLRLSSPSCVDVRTEPTC